MSATTYNTLTSILLTSSLIALAVAVLYLVAAIVGWRSPYRRSRLLRFFGFLVLCPALIGAQYYLLWGIFIPSMREAAEQENAVRRQERYAASSHVAIGDSAPAFELADIDGKNFSIDALRGKVVLLNFFATWCGPCLMELPRMQKLWEQYGENEKFSMLVIGREESQQAVSEFRIKNHYSFPMAADPNREVFSLFAEEYIPRIFLISADGKIAYATLGFDEGELTRLEKLLSQSLP